MLKHLALRLFFVHLVVAGLAVQNTFGQEPPWNRSLPPGLSELLQDIHKKYGPDAVALLGRLLDTATRSGGILTSSVEVQGTETQGQSQDQTEQTFLVFHVETGLVFHSNESTQPDRLLTLWKKIIAQSFASFHQLKFPTDGVLISLRYHHKVYANQDELYDAIDEPGTEVQAKFYFLGTSLAAFLKEEISAQELLTQAKILADSSPIDLQLPTSPAS